MSVWNLRSVFKWILLIQRSFSFLFKFFSLQSSSRLWFKKFSSSKFLLINHVLIDINKLFSIILNLQDWIEFWINSLLELIYILRVRRGAKNISDFEILLSFENAFFTQLFKIFCLSNLFKIFNLFEDQKLSEPKISDSEIQIRDVFWEENWELVCWGDIDISKQCLFIHELDLEQVDQKFPHSFLHDSLDHAGRDEWIVPINLIRSFKLHDQIVSFLSESMFSNLRIN